MWEVVCTAGEGSRRDVASHQQQPVSTVAAATPTHISVVPASSSSAAAGPRRQSVPGGPMATGNKSPVPGEIPCYLPVTVSGKWCVSDWSEFVYCIMYLYCGVCVGVTMSRTGPTQSSAALPGYSANNSERQLLLNTCLYSYLWYANNKCRVMVRFRVRVRV